MRNATAPGRSRFRVGDTSAGEVRDLIRGQGLKFFFGEDASCDGGGPQWNLALSDQREELLAAVVLHRAHVVETSVG